MDAIWMGVCIAQAVAIAAVLLMWAGARRKLHDAADLLDMEAEAARQAASDATMEDVAAKTEAYWMLSGVAQRLKEMMK